MLTLINCLIDFGAYIGILVMFGTKGYEYASVFMIFINMGFALSNSIYFIWATITILKLPKDMRVAFLKSILGFVGSMRAKIRKSLEKRSGTNREV